MKLFFDARWVPAGDRFDGIGRYALGIATALADRDDVELTWLYDDPRQLAKLPPRPSIKIHHRLNFLAELFLARKLNPLHPDVVYSPFYTILAPGKRFMLISTIHDLTYFYFRTPPQWLPWYTRLGWWLFNSSFWPTRLLLKQADAVATVSDTVKQQLHEKGMGRQPFFVVPNAGSEASKKVRAADHSVSNDIVYMGAFTPYKNVETLIDAMAALPDYTLHLLSGIPPVRKQQLLVRAHEKAVQQHVVFHEGVTDGEYFDLLASARCLVTASRMEGFGLPIIEAQANGVPVVCSDIPIFHEVAGKGAVYFDPTSATDCARAIRETATPAVSKKLVEQGYHNSKRFTWDTSAEQIVKNLKQFQKKLKAPKYR